jgi:hypothetical protein
MFFVKFPLVPFVLFLMVFLSLLKYVLVVPLLIRWCERFNAWFTTKVLMMVFSANHIQLTVHPSHSSYDFIKSQKGELRANDAPLRDTSKKQLILSNHSNLLDFVFLTHYYTPIFTKVVLYHDESGK